MIHIVFKKDFIQFYHGSYRVFKAVELSVCSVKEPTNTAIVLYLEGFRALESDGLPNPLISC